MSGKKEKRTRDGHVTPVDCLAALDCRVICCLSYSSNLPCAAAVTFSAFFDGKTGPNLLLKMESSHLASLPMFLYQQRTKQARSPNRFDRSDCLNRWSCVNAQPDARFLHVLDLIERGEFGWADYFAPVVESVRGSRDFYLVANDFPSYIQTQVG